jgi:hypothetical protein
MMYETVIPVSVEPDDAALAIAAGQMTEQLATIDDQTPELLDYAVSSDDAAHTIVFELTVDADDEMQALAGALSWVRTAVHAAGGSTPGWSVGSLGDVSVEQVSVQA